MKTKKILEQIEAMANDVADDLNELSERINNKPNKSEIQTIAKHVMNLESRLEELEKEQKCEGDPGIQIFAVNCTDGVCSIGEKVYPVDYFLKAKNLLIDYAEKTMIKKGIEYTPVGDRFANFRPILGEKKTAIEKLIGYNAKHVQYCFMQETNMTAKTINELLEHWGDVFNYNVLGLAMQNTDRSKAFVVPYADRQTQEKEIKNIVDSVKNITFYGAGLTKDDLYVRLLNTIHNLNLSAIIFLFAKQLERLEGK